MNVLVIYAHPNPKSFNHAILDSFTRGLAEGGHTFEVDDICSGKFDPSFEPEDFAQFTGKPMPQDVLEEQAKVARSDALAFIHPVWWWGQPAILKGWLDRVFSVGFAYRVGKPGTEKLLKHQKVLILSTTGGSEVSYKTSGIEDVIKKLDEATFTHVCGIQHVEHVFLYSVGRDPEARKRYLELAYCLGKEF